MVKGTTPTFVFQLDSTTLDLTALSQIWVTVDDSREVKTWDINSVTVDNEHKTISLYLSQAETLALRTGLARVQIRMLTSDGASIATTCSTITINDVLKKGVIE